MVWVKQITLVALLVAPGLAWSSPLKPIVSNDPPATTVFSWEGFYAGANLGYGWARANNDLNAFATQFGIPGSTICPPNGGAFCLSGSGTNKIDGAIGGLQTGYNWQVGKLLAGIETDVQVSNQRSAQGIAPSFALGPALTENAAVLYTQRIAWLGTLRGRVGVAVDRLIFYGTGGLAYAGIESTGSATAPAFFDPALTIAVPCTGSACPLASPWTNDQTKLGWTIGAGIEGAVFGAWSIKVEYLYVDLGSAQTTFTTLAGCYGSLAGGACTPSNPGTGTITGRVTDNIFRVGLNYRIGGQ